MMNRGCSSARTVDIGVVYKKIQEQIQKELQDELIKLHDGQSMDWNFIRKYLEKLPTPQVHTRSFWDFFRFLMDIFDSYKIGDLSLVEDVLQYASYAMFFFPINILRSTRKQWFKQRNFYREKNLIPFEGVDDVMETFPKNMEEKDLWVDSSIHLLRKIPYAWEKENWNKLTSCQFHIAWEFAGQGNDYVLSILLKHGVSYLKPTDIVWFPTRSYAMYTFITSCTESQVNFSELYDFISKRSKFNPRIYDVLRAVEIIAEILHHGKIYSRVRSFVSCFRKICDSIPDPFLTIQEVRETMEGIVRAFSKKSQFPMLDQMYEEFENNFPESTGPRTPRSLKHLCRWQIRECFRKVHGLPYKVSLLPIPIRLQKYINLEL